MANELSGLTPRNLLALGLAGFSVAFASFLLRELYTGHGSAASAVLNLAATALLAGVCAVAWPTLLTPREARSSWRTGFAVALACALAVAARLPALQA